MPTQASTSRPAYTLTDVGEAIGIVRTARAVDIPIAISFTIETDRWLPSGRSLAQTISEVDRTDAPEYYPIIRRAAQHLDRRRVLRYQRSTWSQGASDLRAGAERTPPTPPRFYGSGLSKGDGGSVRHKSV